MATSLLRFQAGLVQGTSSYLRADFLICSLVGGSAVGELLAPIWCYGPQAIKPTFNKLVADISAGDVVTTRAFYESPYSGVPYLGGNLALEALGATDQTIIGSDTNLLALQDYGIVPVPYTSQVPQGRVNSNPATVFGGSVPADLNIGTAANWASDVPSLNVRQGYLTFVFCSMIRYFIEQTNPLRPSALSSRGVVA